MSAPLYLGLVHYPIYNRNYEVITTALTNLDVHDIARSCRTFGVKRYFVIHPLESQVALAQQVIDYWQNGPGAKYNPDRADALSVLATVPSIPAAVDRIAADEGERPFIVTTDARTYSNTISYPHLREQLSAHSRPCLLLFGTGWGIEKQTMAQFDYILEPIYGRDGYNHLSVRAAVAIILDRILGQYD